MSDEPTSRWTFVVAAAQESAVPQHSNLLWTLDKEFSDMDGNVIAIFEEVDRFPNGSVSDAFQDVVTRFPIVGQYQQEYMVQARAFRKPDSRIYEEIQDDLRDIAVELDVAENEKEQALSALADKFRDMFATLPSTLCPQQFLNETKTCMKDCEYELQATEEEYSRRLAAISERATDLKATHLSEKLSTLGSQIVASLTFDLMALGPAESL